MEKYQTFGRRVVAGLLDTFLLFVVNLIVSGFLAPAGDKIGFIVTGIISLAYYVLLHYHYGQSIGKMALKVKVLDDSETPLNFGQVILRYLPQLLPVMFAVSFSTAGENSSAELWQTLLSGLMMLFALADIIVCLSNDRRRALHDFIAGTIVVRTDV